MIISDKGGRVAYIATIVAKDGEYIKQYNGDSQRRIAEMWAEAIKEMMDLKGYKVKVQLTQDPKIRDQSWPNIRVTAEYLANILKRGSQ